MLAKNRRYRSLGQFMEAYAEMYEGASIMFVTFILTHQCNLQCSYCYEHSKDEARMSLETARRCVELLFEMDEADDPYLKRADGIILDFIGGEPLLEAELMGEIMRYFREEAMRRDHRWAVRHMVSMSTNGLLYFSPAVQNFLEENEGRVSMGVTIDGDRATHDACRRDCNGCGSYDRSVAAYMDLKERHGQKGTKFTIAPANVGHVFEACKDMIERLDVDVLYCNCVYEEGWTEAHAATLYQELKKLADWVLGLDRQVILSIFDEFIGRPLPESDTQNWCGGDGRMLAFDCDGTCYPCVRYAPLSMTGRPLLRIGDVEHGVGKLPKDKATVDRLWSITRQSQSSAECLACPIASGCSWCTAYNYEVTGTPDRRVTYICPMHKARVLAASYYWNHIYRQRGADQRFPLNVPRAWAVPLVGEAEFELLEGLARAE